MNQNFDYITAVNYEDKNETKKNNLFPNIPNFSKIYDVKIKSSIHFKKERKDPLRNYLNEKKDEIKSKKKDYKSATSGFKKTLAQNFIQKRKNKIENEMNQLYINDNNKINNVLNNMEKQKSFKNILEYKEKLVLELKKKYNILNYDLKQLNNRLEFEDKNKNDNNDEKYQFRVEILCKQDDILNENILQETFKEPLYLSKKDELKKDLFTLKKKTEILKLKTKESEKINKELDKEMNKLVENTNIILDDLFYINNEKNNNNKKLEKIYQENFQNDLSHLEDEFKLNKIIKYEEKNEEENKKKKKIKEENKRRKIEDKNIEKNKNLLENLEELKNDLEIRITNFDQFMKKINISKYNDIIPTIQSLNESKSSLKDIIENYKIEIIENKKDIEIQKNRLTQLIIDSNKFNTEKDNESFEEEKLRLLELDYNRKTINLTQSEENYHKLNKIFFSCASTVSRIIYQLNNDSNENNSKYEVKRDNIVELLSFIGLRLERMLALIYTKSKIEVGKNIFTKEETIIDGISKPPNYLKLNNKTNVSFDDEEKNKI